MNPQKQSKSLYKKKKKTTSKTPKSNPVMEYRISSLDSSRTSRSWTLVFGSESSTRSHSRTIVQNEHGTLLLGDEGKIEGGWYFLDDIYPLFFHVGGSCGLPSGPIHFLGMIGGKTLRTAEDGLDLEYDCDLVGLGALDDDKDQDPDHDHDHDHDGYVAFVGLEDRADFLGFNNILGLSRTTIGYNFVLINGEEDYISGFVQFTGKYRPTLKFVERLEKIFTEVIFRPPKIKKPILRTLKVKPIKMKTPGLPGGSGPVTNRTKRRLKVSSVPRQLASLEAIRIPVLLSYSGINDGDLELYVPTFDATVVRPPLAVNFSRYVMVSHNHKNCEFLLMLMRRYTAEIIVYRWLDNTVVNLPFIQHFDQDGFFWASGRFRKVVLGGGQSDYRVCVIVFHRSAGPPVGTLIRLYYRQPFQQVWNRAMFRIVPPIQRPPTFFVAGGLFSFLDFVSGTIYAIRWVQGVPAIFQAFLGGLIGGAHCVFSVEDQGRTCVVVHRHDVFSVYDISILTEQLPGGGNQMMCVYNRRVNLSNRNFYCSVCGIGFGAAPLHFGAGPINAIFVGGYRGDCSRLNNYAEIAAQLNAGLQAVAVDFECLRHCHDPLDAARPLLCYCQSAFLLLPLHLLARMIPELVPFRR